jgi:hypothetical protein
VTFKGQGFFPSAQARVALHFGDGEADVAYAKARVEGEPPMLIFATPTPPKPVPCPVVAFGVAMDGLAFTKQPAEPGNKSVMRFTYLDPAKVKKKK